MLRKFLKDVIAFLNAETTYVVLRNYEGLPDEWGHDVDILLPPSLGRAARTYICRRREELPHIEVTVLSRWHFWSCAMVTGGDRLQIDLFTDMTKAWCRYANSAAVLSRRRYHPGGFWVPSQIDERLLLIAKEMLTYGRVRNRYRPGLRERVTPAETEAAERLFHGRLSARGVQTVLRAYQDPITVGRPWPAPASLFDVQAFASWALQRWRVPQGVEHG